MQCKCFIMSALSGGLKKRVSFNDSAEMAKNDGDDLSFEDDGNISYIVD